jgi:GT2 family glycosyltransferase
MLDFSIVIPTYNRPQRLQTCLDSITQLDYPHELFETIVVDDGSELPLDEIVSPYRDRLNITLVRQVNSGPARARNAGADAASGTYLAFTDDDCTLDRHWLTTLNRGFATAPDCLLGGKTINALPENIYSTASQVLIDFLYEFFNVDSTRAQFFASNNFAVSRFLFNRVGQFDITFPLAAAEDREFCDRWLQLGYLLSYIPEALVYHAHELSLQKFWRQQSNYGAGAFHFHQIRLQRGQQLFQSTDGLRFFYLIFYLKLILYPFWTTSQHPKLLLSGLLILSQIANASGFFSKVWSHSSTRSMKSASDELSNINDEPVRQ